MISANGLFHQILIPTSSAVGGLIMPAQPRATYSSLKTINLQPHGVVAVSHHPLFLVKKVAQSS